ncbi:hypothetical protein COI69_28045 [Bacillus cereus]|uniref:Uncharacterized protein n=1 Tax=Bacillus cereus TaxID=1396 RepID=A0A9X7E1J4_BACCE|nr:hypothetical protein [Bacillus cereus]PHA25978.1 hypothetical protein COE70_02855 [Bacillus cereus]PHG75539.1 hypothetical protein COI69_28045 [Bacillus cereus]
MKKKKKIDLNSTLCKIVEECEQVQKIGTFNFKKIDNDFFLTDIDYDLLKLLHLSKKDVINKNLKDICINRKTKNLLYSVCQTAWESNLANVFTICLHDILYCFILKTITSEKVGKMVRGYCVPVNQNGEFRITDSITTFSRNDFI